MQILPLVIIIPTLFACGGSTASNTGVSASFGGSGGVGGASSGASALNSGGMTSKSGTGTSGQTGTNGGNSTAGNPSSAGATAVTAGYDTTITSGTEHTCAVVNGSAYCWGHGGVLGDGTTNDSPVPVQVQGLTSGVTTITSAIGSTTCAMVNGNAYCWGDNTYGQLGDGTTTSSLVPVQVQVVPSGITAIVSGGTHTCAIVGGSVYCWGYASNGVLGDGVEYTYNAAYASAASNTSAVQVLGITAGITAISADGSHTCVVIEGTAHCWGGNRWGQLGINSSTISSSIPVQVQGLTSGVTTVATGTGYTCALVSGSAYCWGFNQSGQLGDNGASNTYTPDGGNVYGTYIPSQVWNLTSGVTAITAGDVDTCALVNGNVQCWGDNHYGQLGMSPSYDSLVPVQVQGTLSGATAVTVGGTHACVMADDKVQCWGRNNRGQLGNNSTTDSIVPVSVQFP